MKKNIGFLSLLMMLTLSCKEKIFLADELPADEVSLIDLANMVMVGHKRAPLLCS